MDCPRALCLAAAFVCAVAGCDMKTLPLWPSSDAASKGTAQDGFKPGEEPEHERVKEIKPATMAALGAFKEQCAQERAGSPDEQEHLREDARKAYQKALEMDPKFVPAHIGLARLYDSRGNHERALAAYHEGLKVMPKDKSLWYDLGMCHARHKEWEPAIENLRKAAELDPDDRQCAKTLGICLARAGRYDESLTCLEKVVGKAEAHCTVARMLHHLKQDEASKEHVQLALEINPKLSAARQLLDELEGGVAPASGQDNNEQATDK